MLTYWVGVAFLVACSLGVPLLRKWTHSRMLGQLGIEGVSVVPHVLGLSGLRVRRPHWEGDVHFESGSLGGGGPRGHLRFTANLKVSTPPLAFYEPGKPGEAPPGDAVIPTGDPEFDQRIAVVGDRAFVERFLGPELRGRLLLLARLGGRIRAMDGGTIEFMGPLVRQAEELKRFLEACDKIVEMTAAATA